MKNPLLVSGAAVLLGACAGHKPALTGEDLYLANCSACHGVFGDGTGPAAVQVPQMVPDLRFIASLNGGEFPHELVTRIVDGREIDEDHSSEVMPKWGEVFRDAEDNRAGRERRVQAAITTLVDYVASIQVSDDD